MDWTEALNSLARQIEEWVSAPESAFHLSQRELPEADVPMLHLVSATGDRVRVEPARFAAHQLPTVVNLYAYPTLRRVWLVGGADGGWEVQSAEGVPMGFAWNRSDFLRLLELLVHEPVHRPGSLRPAS